MGSSSSVPVVDATLTALDKPVAAIDPRYCSPDFLELTARRRFMANKSIYQDARTQRSHFVIKCGMVSHRQTLLDGTSNAPIVNYKGKSFSFEPILYVKAGRKSDGGPDLFQIRVEYKSGAKTDVRVEFRDARSGALCVLDFEGNWHKRHGYFFLAGGEHGARKAVAKVHCPDGCSRSKHRIVVSPNMDAALIVMICETLCDQEEYPRATLISTAASFVVTVAALAVI